MGIFSFFEQIGNIISSVVDIVVFSFEALIKFFQAIRAGFTFVTHFVTYLPVEIASAFILFFSISLIYLLIGRS